MMYGPGLMARMGDGTLRRVADQYEADRIKRETGDQDMFVFQEPETNDREDEQTPWGPVSGQRKPARRKSLLSPDNEDDSMGDPFGNPAANKQQRPQTKFPTNPMAQPLFKSQAKPQSKPLSGPVTGHAAASLNQDGSTKVRMLDKGLDPAVPVKTKKAPANPYQQARTMEKKANAPKPRNAQQDARDMEKKAEKMLEPSVAGKIFNGLVETARKAPAGIVKGVSEGTKAAKKAGGELVDTFLHDEGMHEGLKKAGLFALAGSSLPAAIVGGYFSPSLIAWGGQAARAAGTSLLSNPQMINEGTDFVRGVFDKGSPPPASLGGYAGGGLSEFVERVRKKKPRD